VLPYQLGSQLIQQVCATHSQYFNCSMFNLLNNALAIEKAHGPHRDPKLLEKDPLYVKYDPLGVCVDMREKYSDLVTINNWPALSTVIPQASLGEVPQNVSESSGARKNSNGFNCHECDSEYHLRNNCPIKKKRLAENGKKGNGGGAGDGNGHGANANTDWKFIAPADENAIVTVGGIEYFFCKHCVCKNTRRKGFFNRTHTSTCTTKSSGHKFPSTDDAIVSTTDETTSISSYYSYATSSLSYMSSPGCSLGALLPATKPPPLQPVDENHVDDDPDGLEFVGDFLADISMDDAD